MHLCQGQCFSLCNWGAQFFPQAYSKKKHCILILNAETSKCNLNSPINVSHAASDGLQMNPHQYDAKPGCTNNALIMLSAGLSKSDKYRKIYLNCALLDWGGLCNTSVPYSTSTC